jgi:hypothetical protein
VRVGFLAADGGDSLQPEKRLARVLLLMAIRGIALSKDRVFLSKRHHFFALANS